MESICSSQIPVLPLQRRHNVERWTLCFFAAAAIFGESCDARSLSAASIGLMVVQIIKFEVCGFVGEMWGCARDKEISYEIHCSVAHHVNIAEERIEM